MSTVRRSRSLKEETLRSRRFHKQRFVKKPVIKRLYNVLSSKTQMSPGTRRDVTILWLKRYLTSLCTLQETKENPSTFSRSSHYSQCKMENYSSRRKNTCLPQEWKKAAILSKTLSLSRKTSLPKHCSPNHKHNHHSSETSHRSDDKYLWRARPAIWESMSCWKYFRYALLRVYYWQNRFASVSTSCGLAMKE